MGDGRADSGAGRAGQLERPWAGFPPPRMRSLCLAVAALAAPAALAQVCPGLVGAEALACVAEGYTPTSVLSSAASKDRLYDTVDRTSRDGVDGVEGLYTGYFVSFDGVPNADPSQDVFNDNAGINQEHVFPRSRGTDGHNAEVDLHHLFPTRVSVNADRSNDPFRVLADGATSTWYRDGAQQRTEPADPDSWSQAASGAFEPRASVRGDVARAMFYVAAVYADRVDVAWFERQLGDLLAWHAADGPTAADVARSERVAAFQSGCGSGECVNPFVVDATLAARAFSGATDRAASPTRAIGLAHPNPTAGPVAFGVDGARVISVEVVDALGRRATGVATRAGRERLAVDLSALPAGVYVVRIQTDAGLAMRPVVVAR